jgi:hypothetical protein
VRFAPSSPIWSPNHVLVAQVVRTLVADLVVVKAESCHSGIRSEGVGEVVGAAIADVVKSKG